MRQVFFWPHTTGGVPRDHSRLVAHRLRSKPLGQLDALAEKSPWEKRVLMPACSSSKVLRCSRFTILNRPCHETTCPVFIFSLGLAEQFWLELPISPWLIPARTLDCWQVRSSLGWVPSRWCSTPLGEDLSAVNPSRHCITVTTVESSSCPGREMDRPTLRTLVPAMASRKGCTPP